MKNQIYHRALNDNWCIHIVTQMETAWYRLTLRTIKTKATLTHMYIKLVISKLTITSVWVWKINNENVTQQEVIVHNTQTKIKS